MTYQLLFNTPAIIGKLKLEKDFNDQIFEFKFPQVEVLTISLIVIAGVILVNQIPFVIKEVFKIIQVKRFSFGDTRADYSYIIIAAVKIVIAALILGEREKIVAFILSRQSKSGMQDKGELMN